MNTRWICGLAVVTLFLISLSARAEEKGPRFSIGGRIRGEESFELLVKRNLELRETIRAEAAREKPLLHLGEGAWDLAEVLPVIEPKNNDWLWGPLSFDEDLNSPRVVQLKDDSVLIEQISGKLEWVSRTNLVTASQLEAAFSAYLGKHPQEAEAYLQRACFRAMRGVLDDAISDATRAAKLRPKNPLFLFCRASLWLLHKEVRLALDDFDELISLNKENVDLHLMRAAAFLDIEDDEGALLDLSEAIRLGNKETDVLSTRGRIRGDNGDDKGAIEDFTKALEYLAKDDARRGDKEAFYYHKRACSYAAIGRLHTAIAEFTLAIELKPTVDTIYRERGDTYALLEENFLAISDYEEAIRLKPDNPRTYYSRGKLRLRAKEYDQAIDDFSSVIALEPGSYDAWMWRSYVRGLKKDYQGAIADVTQAHFLNREDFRILEARAKFFDKLGETAKADADWAEIYRLKRDRATRDEFRSFLR